MDELANGRVSVGEKALARCDWLAARAEFEAVLEERPDEPRALEGLAMALFWLGDSRTPRELRERAYVEYRRRGEGRRAAAAAVFVSSEYRMAGENAAAAGGWLARAERCLEGIEVSVEQGWIELERAKTAGSPELAEEHAQRALEIGRQLRDADLEVVALAQLGVRLVTGGRWKDGMALLDEAMAAAMGGEARDALAICDTCCQTLVACDQIADVRRAAEWCRVVVEFTERKNFTPVYAWCRAIYAGVLTATGEWERAEVELLQSLRTYETAGGIGSRVLALARLAELRLRQGRFEESERLLAGCEDHPAALATAVRLRRSRGDLSTAAAMLERGLAALPVGGAARAPLLALLADVRLVQGDAGGAFTAAQELEELAVQLDRDNLRALAEVAFADITLARGEEGTVARLEAALEFFSKVGMPFEASDVRLRLARVLASTGSDLAVEQARHAASGFERLGAPREADEARALLRSLGVASGSAARGDGELTQREREVLELLAEGLSNAEIARRLVISEKTAGHHVSRIFRKLGLRNRTEAAAHVLRQPTAIERSRPRA